MLLRALVRLFGNTQAQKTAATMSQETLTMFRNLFRSRRSYRTARPRRRPACPLALEALESRWCPSTYNAFNDFSLDQNPNGPWSYGTLSSFTGGSFEPFAFTLADGDYPGQAAWHNGQSPPNRAALDKNTSGVEQQFLTVVVPPDMLRLDGESLIADVQFIAPADGVYDVEGLFKHIDTQTVPVSTHIILNGTTELFAADGPMAFGDQRPFSFPALALSAGDVLDFAEGAPQFNNDSTGFDVTLTTPDDGGPGVASGPGRPLTPSQTVVGPSLVPLLGAADAVDGVPGKGHGLPEADAALNHALAGALASPQLAGGDAPASLPGRAPAGATSHSVPGIPWRSALDTVFAAHQKDSHGLGQEGRDAITQDLVLIPPLLHLRRDAVAGSLTTMPPSSPLPSPESNSAKVVDADSSSASLRSEWGAMGYGGGAQVESHSAAFHSATPASAFDQPATSLSARDAAFADLPAV